MRRRLTNEQRNLIKEFITPTTTTMDDFSDEIYEKIINILSMYTPYKSKSGVELIKAREANRISKEYNKARGLLWIDPYLHVNQLITELNTGN